MMPYGIFRTDGLTEEGEHMNGVTAGWVILCAILALLMGYSIYNGIHKRAPNAITQPQR